MQKSPTSYRLQLAEQQKDVKNGKVRVAQKQGWKEIKRNVALVDLNFMYVRLICELQNAAVFTVLCVRSEKISSSLNITLTLNDIPPMVDGDSKTRNAFTEESCIAIRAVKSSNLYHPSMCRMKNADGRWRHMILCFAALNVNFVIQRGLIYCCLMYTRKS